MLDNFVIVGDIKFEKTEEKEFEKGKDVLKSIPVLKWKHLMHIILKEEYHDNLAFISVLTSLLFKRSNTKTETVFHFEPSKDDKQCIRVYKRKK